MKNDSAEQYSSLRSDRSRSLFQDPSKIRIAVVQLESHPAFAIGHSDWLSEPFFSEIPCLEQLDNNEFSEAKDLKRICRERYLRWAEVRLRGVLQWFRERFPIDDENKWPHMPDIIVFPEGAIPREHLYLLVEFARETLAVVFAGTHTFEVSEDAVRDYNRLGVILHNETGEPKCNPDPSKTDSFTVSEDEVRRLHGIHPNTRREMNRILGKRLASVSVLPVIVPNEMPNTSDIRVYREVFQCEFGERPEEHASRYLGETEAKQLNEAGPSKTSVRKCTVRLRAKTILSPFEATEGGWNDSPETPEVIRVELPGRAIRNGDCLSLRVLPMVCSEALNRLAGATPDRQYDLLVIPSFNADFRHFFPLIEYHAQRQIPVAYCNDGLFGDSTISFKRDTRHSAAFFACPYEGRLPKGADGILVADVTPGYGGGQAGVSNPRQFYNLVALAAIVHDGQQNPPSHVAKVLEAARKLMTNIPSSDNCTLGTKYSAADPFQLVAEVRKRLEKVRHENAPTKVQEINLKHLIRLTSDPSNAYPYEWINHAWDCVVMSSHQTVHSNVPPDEYLSTSLQDLDGDLAALCHIRTGRWFEQELGSRDGRDASRATVLTRVRQECRKRMGDGLGRVLAHLERIKDDSRSKAKERLHHIVGTLVERFGATSAWLLPVHEPSGGEPDFHSDPSLYITHNTTVRYRGRLRDKRGIVARVLRTREAYLVNAVSDSTDQLADPYYQEFMFTTRSELAVPIFDCGLTNPRAEGDPGRPKQPRLLAVLNLESTRTGAFLPMSAGELQAAVALLVPDLIIFMSASGMDALTAWHPDIHQWGATNLLDQLCYSIATPFGRTGEPGLTCTLWNYDRVKRQIQARSTIGFDYEYLTRSALSENSLVGKVIERTNDTKFNSSTAEDVALNDDLSRLRKQLNRQGPRVYRVDLASSTIQPLGNDNDWEFVARKRKVRNMGIAEMIVAPLLGRARPYHLNLDGVNVRRSFGLRAEGSINLYVYTHNPARDGSGAELLSQDETVFRLADLANRTVVDFYRLQRRVIAATVMARLAEWLYAGVPPFEILRSTLTECFESDGCSILCRDESQDAAMQRIGIVATSGLAFRGVIDSRGHSGYRYLDLAKHEQQLADSIATNTRQVAGITHTLLSRGGRTIRMLDVCDNKEPVRFFRCPSSPYPNSDSDLVDEEKRVSQTPITVHLAPIYLNTETLSPTDSVHHRFLGVSFGAVSDVMDAASSAALGGIRLVRRIDARTFVRHDELVLEDVARTVAPLFEYHVHDRSTSSRRMNRFHAARSIEWSTWPLPLSIAQKGNSSSDEGGDCDAEDSVRARARQEAVRRLVYASVGPIGWNRNFVRGFLQDVMTVFESDGAVLADLRFVVLTDAGASLRPYEVLSAYSQQQPDEAKGRDVTCCHMNNGWRAIFAGHPIYFPTVDSEFTPIHRDSSLVRSGLCLPFRMFAHDHLVEGVLSIDFIQPILLPTAPNEKQEPVWTIQHIEFLALAVRQLSYLSLSNQPDEKRLLSRGDLEVLDSNPVEAWNWVVNKIRHVLECDSLNDFERRRRDDSNIEFLFIAFRIVNSDAPDSLVRSTIEGERTIPKWIESHFKRFAEKTTTAQIYAACCFDKPDVDLFLYGVALQHEEWLFSSASDASTEFVFPLFLGSGYVGHLHGRICFPRDKDLETAEQSGITSDDSMPVRQVGVARKRQLRELRSVLSKVTEYWCRFACGNLVLAEEENKLWLPAPILSATEPLGFRLAYHWGSWASEEGSEMES